MALSARRRRWMDRRALLPMPGRPLMLAGRSGWSCPARLLLPWMLRRSHCGHGGRHGRTSRMLAAAMA
eukprot:9013012-Alexandrium_andersonii.AAC.1